MNQQIALPIVMLEKETGDLQVIDTLSDALLVAWEFLDILEDDFEFWDALGRSVTATPSSSRPVDFVIGNDDTVAMRRRIASYLEQPERDESVASRLRTLVDGTQRP